MSCSAEMLLPPPITRRASNNKTKIQDGGDLDFSTVKPVVPSSKNAVRKIPAFQRPVVDEFVPLVKTTTTPSRKRRQSKTLSDQQQPVVKKNPRKPAKPKQSRHDDPVKPTPLAFEYKQELSGHLHTTEDVSRGTQSQNDSVKRRNEKTTTYYKSGVIEKAVTEVTEVVAQKTKAATQETIRKSTALKLELLNVAHNQPPQAARAACKSFHWYKERVLQQLILFRERLRQKKLRCPEFTHDQDPLFSGNANSTTWQPLSVESFASAFHKFGCDEPTSFMSLLASNGDDSALTSSNLTLPTTSATSATSSSTSSSSSSSSTCSTSSSSSFLSSNKSQSSSSSLHSNPSSLSLSQDATNLLGFLPMSNDSSTPIETGDNDEESESSDCEDVLSFPLTPISDNSHININANLEVSSKLRPLPSKQSQLSTMPTLDSLRAELIGVKTDDFCSTPWWEDEEIVAQFLFGIEPRLQRTSSTILFNRSKDGWEKLSELEQTEILNREYEQKDLTMLPWMACCWSMEEMLRWCHNPNMVKLYVDTCIGNAVDLYDTNQPLFMIRNSVMAAYCTGQLLTQHIPEIRKIMRPEVIRDVNESYFPSFYVWEVSDNMWQSLFSSLQLKYNFADVSVVLCEKITAQHETKINAIRSRSLKQCSAILEKYNKEQDAKSGLLLKNAVVENHVQPMLCLTSLVDNDNDNDNDSRLSAEESNSQQQQTMHDEECAEESRVELCQRLIAEVKAKCVKQMEKQTNLYNEELRKAEIPEYRAENCDSIGLCYIPSSAACCDPLFVELFPHAHPLYERCCAFSKSFASNPQNPDLIPQVAQFLIKTSDDQ